ncbi:MAG: HAD family hydrolase [Clostridiaceae bacterium]
MKNKKLAIFDMDGLLLDTEKLFFEAALNVANENNYNISRELLMSTLGVTDEQEKRIFREALGTEFPLDTFFRTARESMFSRIEIEGIAVKEGLLELLDFLERNNILRVVATSRYREQAEWLLAKAGIKNRFHKIICGDDVKNGKPAPDIFLKACELMGVDKSEAVVLEDSINGLRAAKAAEIKCILIPDIINPTTEEEKLAYIKLKNLKEVIKLNIE